MDGLAVFLFMFLIGISVSIFYTTVVWRAMRAYERLADAHERLAESIQNLGNQMQPDR